MLFLIQGDAQTVYSAFGRSGFIAYDARRNAIRIDVERTCFFGTASECMHHRSVWLSNQSSIRSYAQGNMSAGNLFLLFGHKLPLPFFKEGEEDEDVIANTNNICFAYVDQNKDLHGLILYFRKDDPTKWLIGLSKNPHLQPENVDIKVLTPFDPRPYRKLPCEIKSGAETKDEFIEAIGSPRLAKFIKYIITLNEELNPCAEIIKLFLQNAVSESNFVVNDELLAFFEQEIPKILASKELRLLLDYDLQPSPQQIQACLDPETELYKLLSAFERGDNDRQNKAQLTILLLLDRYGLNERQEAIRSDNVFVEKLSNLSNVHQDFLPILLADPFKTEVLRFLTQGDHCSELLLQLKQIEDQQIWQKIIDLAKWPWQFPQDAYRHAVITKLLLNIPDISEKNLQAIYECLGKKEISEVLKKVFDPFVLANYLAAKPAEGFDLLMHANDFFAQILPKYEGTARLTNRPLSPQLLAALAEQYVKNPGDALLASLYYCHSKDQIKAGCILNELGFLNLPAYLLNPVVVSAVNLLESCNLKPCITHVLNNESLFVALGEIHQLETETLRKASLILVSQNALNADEFRQLLEDFRTYPGLAHLVILAHKKNCSVQQIKELAFSPRLHQAASTLFDLGIEFNFNQLTPFTCQFLFVIADLIKTQKAKETLSGYLKGVLPGILRFLNKEISWDELKPYIQGQDSLLREEDEESAQHLTGLIIEQLNAFVIASHHGISSDMQMTKSKQLAKDTGRTIKLLSEKLKEKSVPEEQRRVLYEHVFAFFSSLDAHRQVAVAKVPQVIDALISCNLQGSMVSLDSLLQSPFLAGAILALDKLHLPAADLLDKEQPLQDEIAASLVKLGQVGPENVLAFKLAMQDDSKGHDFRLLLARMGRVNKQQPYLITLLHDGIVNRRTWPEFENIEKNVAGQRNKAQGYDLDESLILMNRLRALNFNDQVIEFLAKDNDKSRQFHKAVLRVETECQTIRSRLKIKAKDKWQQLSASEPEYRKGLYQALYEALINPCEPKEQKNALGEFTNKLNQAAKHITDIVEIDRDPEARIAMMVIVNILTLVFTLSIANWVHQKNTGDFLFFYRPASSEALNSLNKQILEETATEIMAAPAG